MRVQVGVGAMVRRCFQGRNRGPRLCLRGRDRVREVKVTLLILRLKGIVAGYRLSRRLVNL